MNSIFLLYEIAFSPYVEFLNKFFLSFACEFRFKLCLFASNKKGFCKRNQNKQKLKNSKFFPQVCNFEKMEVTKNIIVRNCMIDIFIKKLRHQFFWIFLFPKTILIPLQLHDQI